MKVTNSGDPDGVRVYDHPLRDRRMDANRDAERVEAKPDAVANAYATEE